LSPDRGRIMEDLSEPATCDEIARIYSKNSSPTIYKKKKEKRTEIMTAHLRYS